MHAVFRIGHAAAFLAVAALGLHAAPDEIVAVSSRVSNGYVRQRLPDGSFRPEYYVFGEGGVWQGAARDVTSDKMNFLEVAHAIALPLASQKYLPGKDPKTTNLLIMVYWGTTQVTEGPDTSVAYNNLETANTDFQQSLSGHHVLESNMNINSMDPSSLSALAAADTALGAVEAENRLRDRRNEQNASILGYDSWWASTSDDLALGPVRRAQREIMMAELEDPRYFVVLLAYDWEAMSRHKEHKLWWETRYSIRSRGHDFSADLAAMTREASRYFGNASDGLVHEVPEGHVRVGELKVVGDSSPKK